MRSELLLIATILAFMSGCSSESGVITRRHIQMVTEKCNVNGGMKHIVDAQKAPIFENCGYRCSKETGQSNYKVTFSCNNGANFNLSWNE